MEIIHSIKFPLGLVSGRGDSNSCVNLRGAYLLQADIFNKLSISHFSVNGSFQFLACNTSREWQKSYCKSVSILKFLFKPKHGRLYLTRSQPISCRCSLISQVPFFQTDKKNYSRYTTYSYDFSLYFPKFIFFSIHS